MVLHLVTFQYPGFNLPEQAADRVTFLNQSGTINGICGLDTSWLNAREGFNRH